MLIAERARHLRRAPKSGGKLNEIKQRRSPGIADLTGEEAQAVDFGEGRDRSDQKG
jgi:hypothetical protein